MPSHDPPVILTKPLCEPSDTSACVLHLACPSCDVRNALFLSKGSECRDTPVSHAVIKWVLLRPNGDSSGSQSVTTKRNWNVTLLNQ
jgi:hypothetical protein